MQCIVVKSDEFENSSPLYIFPLNPDYVAARSLRSLRSNYVIFPVTARLRRENAYLHILWRTREQDFLSPFSFFQNSTPEKMPTFDELNEME